MTAEARALVFEGAGQPLRVTALPLPDLQPGELLVRVCLCTLCGSDLHTYTGRRSAPVPLILGHEILGTVEQLPQEQPIFLADGQSVRLGDRVVWSVAAGCGACFYCNHDLPQKCELLVKYGHERLAPPHLLSGGLATHCHLVRGTAVYRVPEELPDLVACPASCATATVAAALRHAGELRDTTVLILGAGMLGLTAAAWARATGASQVIVFDTDRTRTALALRFGASWAVSDPAEVREVVLTATAGRGADLALEMSGQPTAIELGLELLRIGGRFLWVGAVAPTRAVPVLPEVVVRKHLTIQGVHNYQPRDLGAALDALSRWHHTVPFQELVPAGFPLAQANAAFQFALDHKPVRVAVNCQE